jgi:hypothetical protein
MTSILRSSRTVVLSGAELSRKVGLENPLVKKSSHIELLAPHLAGESKYGQ